MKNIFSFIKKNSGIQFLVLPMFLILACEGPRGDIGPRGNDGTNGADGIDGVDGVDGVDGINYTRTAIFDILPIDWSGNLDRYDVTLDIPEITEDIYYDGAVLVYSLVEVDPISFNMLPYTYMDNNYAMYMDFDVYIGSVNVFIKEIIDGINTTARPDEQYAFKVVIIEGISLDALSKKVDVRNFEAVSDFVGFNLNSDIY